MPFEQSWLIENAVVFTEYSGEVTLDEVTESIEEVLWRFNISQRQLIHMVVDTKDLDAHPTNLAEINRIVKPLLQHKQAGWFIMLGNQNPVTKFLAEMLAQISRVRFRAFGNWEEAREFLQGMDAGLPELPETTE